MLQRSWIMNMHRLMAVGVLAWVANRASVLLGACWSFDTDDAFITLRYAKHLSQGHGIVWNIGDAPVEGYSNFLFVLLGAACENFGVEPMLGLKVVSSAALAGTFAAMYALSRTFVGPLASCLGPLLLVVHPGASYWTVSGLETAVYQFEVVTAAYLCARALGHRSVGWYPVAAQRVTPGASGWTIACAAICLLAALTRPEGPLIAICVNLALAVRWLSSRSSQDQSGAANIAMRRAVLFGLTFGMTYGTYFLWRWQYFGQLLPNPVYCKGSWQGDAWKMLTDFWESSSPVIIAAMLYPLRKLDARHVPLLLLALMYAFVLHGTNPIIGYYDRHWMAVFALLLVAATAAVTSIARLFLGSQGWNLEVLICAGVLFATMPKYEKTRQEITYASERYVRRNNARADVARYLNSHLSPEATYVIGDCGVIPYATPQRVIDAYCLNSAEMTGPEIDLSATRFVRWTLEEKPEAYVVQSSRRDRVSPRLEHGNMFYVALMKEKSFKRDYRQVHVAGARGDRHHYHVYQRNDLPMPDQKKSKGSTP